MTARWDTLQPGVWSPSPRTDLARAAERAAELAAIDPVTGSIRLYRIAAERKPRHRAEPAWPWRRRLDLAALLMFLGLLVLAVAGVLG